MFSNEKSTQKKKIYDENVWQSCNNSTNTKTKNAKVNKKTSDPSENSINMISCKKCFRVFKNANGLGIHQRICLKPEKGESFLKYVYRQKKDRR